MWDIIKGGILTSTLKTVFDHISKHIVFSTLFSVFGNVVKHGFSCLIYFLYYFFHVSRWSFGILLWETFTLGGTPYPGLPTDQLLDYLSEGKRMENPAKCPLEVYTVMRDCWLHEPDQRPQFTTLNERLGKILERNMTTVQGHPPFVSRFSAVLPTQNISLLTSFYEEYYDEVK